MYAFGVLCDGSKRGTWYRRVACKKRAYPLGEFQSRVSTKTCSKLQCHGGHASHENGGFWEDIVEIFAHCARVARRLPYTFPLVEKLRVQQVRPRGCVISTPPCDTVTQLLVMLLFFGDPTTPVQVTHDSNSSVTHDAWPTLFCFVCTRT